MSRDLYAQETAERFGQFSGSQVPEPDLWTGFPEGAGKLALRGIAATGRAMDLMGALPAITRDYFKGTTEEQDKYFQMHDFRWNRLIDSLTPGPKDVGIATQVVGSLLGTLPQIILNPPLGIASMQLSSAEDLVREGVPAWKANLEGMTEGATLAAGIRMPILGNNLLTRMLVGGAAANVGLGVANRAISGAILAGEPAAERYKAFDTVGMLTDTIMGLAFGAYTHMSPEARAQGGEALKDLSDWAQRLKPSDLAALAALRQAQHSNVDSMPGKPVDPTDVEAHVNRLKAAIGQLAQDRPVQVEDMPKPRFTPDPGKQAEELAVSKVFTEAAEEVRIQEELVEPTLPADMRPTEERVAANEQREEPSSAPPELPAGSPPPLHGETPVASGPVTADEIQIVARASALDAAAVEKAGQDFADNPAAFINEMRRIIDEKVGQGESQETDKTQGEGAEADPQALVLAQEADRVVAANPDQVLTVGTDAAGNSITVKASEYLAEARAAAARAREDIPLFEVAAGCLIGRS